MSHIITNWENDLIDSPEDKVIEFVNAFYKGFELKLLSGLKYRTIEEIYETLTDSFVIIMRPSLLNEQQVTELVKGISHGIWINFNSNVNNLSVRRFIFLSAMPFEDAKEILRMCKGLKDNHGEPALTKIVKNISCQFFGFGGEYYEMIDKGYFNDDIYIVRHR